jgi:subtilisin family serine protease
MTRIVVIDSGIDGGHPGLRGRARIEVGRDFASVPDSGEHDLLGHGTAVAATIVRLGGERPITLHSLRVFGREPVVDFGVVLAALQHAVSLRPALINLSLGTTSLRHRDGLLAVVAAARAAGARLVAPASYGGLPCDPGNLADVEAVCADPNVLPQCPELRRIGARWLWFASPLAAADADGVRRATARGDSLAVAAVTGCLLRSLPATATPAAPT